MADLIREACVVADDAASRLDAAPAVDLLLAGRDTAVAPSEDDIAEPEERREDARHREIRDSDDHAGSSRRRSPRPPRTSGAALLMPRIVVSK